MKRPTCQPPETQTRRHTRQWGFTLIELLVVLVILGLLAGLIGPQVMKHVGASKTKTAKLQIEELVAALDMYRLEVGDYPTGEQGLKALVEKPADLEVWAGPYLRKKVLPKDPWGRDYHYRYPGENGDFDIYSLGADGAEGGEGESSDVVSWE
jgi:general secretion pathway protein G